MSEITIKSEPLIKSGTSQGGKPWQLAKFVALSEKGKEFNIQCWGEDDVALLRNCSIGDKISCHIDPDKTLYTVGAITLIDSNPKAREIIDDDIPF